MSAYPYAGRDLFAAPESYEYAPCASEDFFIAWRSSRNEARERLQRRAASAGSALSPRRAASAAMAGSLHALLDDVRVAPPQQTKATIDALVQKFDIYRRLFSAYDANLRKADGAVPVAPADYVPFAEALAAWADMTNSLKYLSTLLKTVDALCSLPAERLDGESAARLVSIIVEERRLVDRWAARCDP